MTKKRLQAYQNIVNERRQIECLVEQLALDGKTEALSKLLDHYQAVLDTLAAEQLAIETAIASLPPTERMLLRYRYIFGWRWEKVYTQMHYCERQVHNIHTSALNRLNKKPET